ncbi:hypothetical protein ES706_04284 [subsurface metagenome]
MSIAILEIRLGIRSGDRNDEKPMFLTILERV